MFFVNWNALLVAKFVAENSQGSTRKISDEKSTSSAPAGCGDISCGNCGKVVEQLSSGQGRPEPAPIAQVLMVFFLPLACAAVVVVWAVRSWSVLAEHPGYVLLTALGVTVGVLVLVRLLGGKKQDRPESK